MGKFGATLVAITACGTAHAKVQQDPASMSKLELLDFCNAGVHVEWEPKCTIAGHSLVGCIAHTGCRRCGGNPEQEVPCKDDRQIMKDALLKRLRGQTLKDKLLGIRTGDLDQAQIQIMCETTPANYVTWNPECLQMPRQGVVNGCFFGGVHQECQVHHVDQVGKDPSAMTVEELREYCNVPKTDTNSLDWEPGCRNPGRVGCNYYEEHVECRVCGGKNVPCKAQLVAEQANLKDKHPSTMEPAELRITCGVRLDEHVRWNSDCVERSLPGCFLGGIHQECQQAEAQEVP